MEGLKRYEGKRVFLILKNKRQYSGIVVEVIDLGNELQFMTINDKFGKDVSFSSNEIELIQEEA